jgi:cysteine synthase A
MKTAKDLTELIGHTPLLRLGRLAPEHELYAKCEFLNPISLKDRPVRQIIADAEADGRLQPGSTLVEATSGNTGMAVASLAALKGYKAILVMSEIQSVERRRVLRALGAELVLTPAAEGTAGARRKLKQILAEHPDYFYVGQHINPSNPRAHYRTTGPELWRDTDGRIDILVAGLGTGGTLCGAGRYLKEQKPSVQTIAVEPKESPFISQGVFQPHRLMGTAPGFVPETLDRDLIDEIVLVSEEEAFATCRAIAREEGLLVGISSGAAAFAAGQVARRPANAGKLIVCVFADTGQRYLSVDGLFAQENL